MTFTELQEQSEANWARVPQADCERCVQHLRKQLSPEDTAWLRDRFQDGDFPPGWHFFAGMGIRNTLREVLHDIQLPTVDYGDGRLYRNWDDYYMAALKEAVS